MKKCNMDCFNCKLPVEKCHGGGNCQKTANTFSFPNKEVVGKGYTPKGSYRKSHKVSHGFVK